MKSHIVRFLAPNQAVLIGRFMLVFSRRKIDVTNFSFKKINEEEGEFIIEFNADELTAQNVEKQLNKQIDVFEAVLLH